MLYDENRGNLFELDSRYALAHCISYDTDNLKSWGRGIVIEFRKRFPQIKEYVDIEIKKNNLKWPCVVIYKNKDRVIFNLITKESYYKKPTYKSITKCIKEMAYLCKLMNIEYLGLPKIGCGLDKLSWDKVRKIIKDEFCNLDIQIKVCYL